jgi:ribonuclease BN (tRNA processing enzyme)
MECLPLGSGGMMPLPYRFLTPLAVRHQGHPCLFDAGEGCQINLKRATFFAFPEIPAKNPLS